MKPQLALAFLTGQSDPGRNALSPAQAEFLAYFAAPDRLLVPANFPYGVTPPWRPVSLLRASWCNFRLYRRSRRPDFAAAWAGPVADLIRRADGVCFLAGSCGLELFNNLRLPARLEARCLLICYGPVARHRPRHAQAVIVQGSRDWISRLGFPAGAPRLRCGHLDYLRDADFRRLCADALAAFTPLPCSNTSA